MEDIQNQEATPEPNEGSNQGGDFLNLLSEDLRSDPSVRDFKTGDDLAKSYISAQKMIGRSIRIPTEDTAPEAKESFYNKLQEVPGVVRLPDPEDKDSVDSFYNKLGRPESPDQYDLGLSDPDMVNLDALKEYQEYAHEIGLTNTQAKALIEVEAKKAQSEVEVLNQQREISQATLKEKWGAEYDNRMSLAKLALDSYSEDFPDQISEILNSPAGNNPALIHLLSEFGKMVQESPSIGGQASRTFGMTAEEAKDAISEIRSNKSHAYYNQNDPSHKEAVERVNRLYSIAYNG